MSHSVVNLASYFLLLEALCTPCFSDKLVINHRSPLTDSSNDIKGDAFVSEGKPKNREENAQKHPLALFFQHVCVLLVISESKDSPRRLGSWKGTAPHTQVSGQL